MERLEEQVRLYRDRVAAFIAQAQVWCAARGLVVDVIPTELFEKALPKYEAAGLRIATPDRQPLAELLPTGSAIIGALGRIDLRGDLARHAFLFRTGGGSAMPRGAEAGDERTWARESTGMDGMGPKPPSGEQSGLMRVFSSTCLRMFRT